MVSRIVGYMLEGDTPVPVYAMDGMACEQFSEWLKEERNRIIERTSIHERLLVVTSFLGLNRARYPRKELVLWETQVLRNGAMGSTHLCSSGEAARTVHWEVVYSLLRKECLPIPLDIRCEIEEHVPSIYCSEVSAQPTPQEVRTSRSTTKGAPILANS